MHQKTLYQSTLYDILNHIYTVPYQYPSLEQVVGALVNSVFLVALCFSITVESVKRFLDPEEIKDPKLILIVGGIGLGINLVSSCKWQKVYFLWMIFLYCSTCRLECCCLETWVMDTAMEDRTHRRRKVTPTRQRMVMDTAMRRKTDMVTAMVDTVMDTLLTLLRVDTA